MLIHPGIIAGHDVYAVRCGFCVEQVGISRFNGRYVAHALPSASILAISTIARTLLSQQYISGFII
jgi:hypothetical protein